MERRRVLKHLVSGLGVAFMKNACALPLARFSKRSKRPLLIGIGGAGCNIVSAIAATERISADLLWTDTDRASLIKHGSQSTRLLLGEAGLGAGTQANYGRACALQAANQLHKILRGHDAVCLVASVRWGTGGGATPVIAEFSRALQLQTLAVAITPFEFEVGMEEHANSTLHTLQEICDVHVIDNEDFFKKCSDDLSMEQLFQAIDRGAEQEVRRFLAACA